MANDPAPPQLKAEADVLELTQHTENLEELFFDLTSDRDLEVRPS